MTSQFEETDLGALTVDLASSFRSIIERGGVTYSVTDHTKGAKVWVDRSIWVKQTNSFLSMPLTRS